MNYRAKKYKFTKADTNKLIKIGYHIVGTSKLELFIQQRFPNFDLVSLLQVVECQFSNTTANQIHRNIYCDKDESFLKIEYKNDFINEDDALLFIRKFISLDNIIDIVHEYCVIPKASRKQGLIKPVFQESLQQYVNIKAKRIIVHAGLSGGGYTWAKHGFIATERAEIDIILGDAKAVLTKSEFAIIKKVYDIYYTKTPTGRSFPIELWAALDYMKPVLLGSDWHGELDLKNKEQFRNFSNYVSR